MRRAVGVVLGLLVALGGLALLPPVGAQVTTQAVQAVDVDLVGSGAWVTWSNGRVEAGSLGGRSVTQPPQPTFPVFFGLGESAVALVPTGDGYWLFTSAGRVFTAGGVPFHGDLAGFSLNDPIVAAAPTASGGGYYMLGADGGVFTFGDARFYGSVQGIVDRTFGFGTLASDHLTAPIVTLATTPDGYWLIAEDGAVFPFGDAPYHGSFQDVLNTGNRLAGITRSWTVTPPVATGVQRARDALAAPIVDIVPSTAGSGYLMLASDGGIFNFGQSQFHGSLAGRSDSPAVASDVTSTRDGYVIVTEQGATHIFGTITGTTNADTKIVADRSTLQGIFAEAAARRQLIIDDLTAKINSGEYGVDDDGFLRGPAGFTINMNTCPDDWSNTTGITDSEIRIGHTTAQSGNLAAYGNIALGWENYLDWVNENDPIMVDGSARDIVLLVKDDAYVAAQTIEFVDELIESENVFSILTLGSPNTLATYDKINDACVPHPFVMTGHPAWGDPVNHPWTSGGQLSYSTEAILWGNWIQEHLPHQLPVKVAGLVMDNDFGLAYESSFHEWAEGNPDVVSEFLPVRHDPAAPTITNEMSTIKAADPDVFISMTAGNPCLLAIQEAGASGLLEDIQGAGGALFTSSVCRQIEAYMTPAGDAADDWWIVDGGVKNITDPAYADEPFIAWLNDNLRSAGFDPTTSLFGFRPFGAGYFYGYPYVESLRIAAELPSGLNRTNFILSVRSTELYHPLLLDGITYSTRGTVDGYPVEGSGFRQFDTSTQTWKLAGIAVDLNRITPNCSWSTYSGRCTTWGKIKRPMSPRNSSGPGNGVTVRMGRANWSTGYFQAEVYKLLLEDLGYTVTDPAELELGSNNAYVVMAHGDFDFWVNSWYPGHNFWLAGELPDQTLVGDHVSPIGNQLVAGGLQGFLIEKTFADKYGIKTLDDLNRNTAALAEYDATDVRPGNGIADIFGCPESWTCDDIMESMIAFSGWDNLAQVKAGYDAMFADAVGRAEDNIPFVIYSWTPSAYITQLIPGSNVYWLGVEKVLDDSNPLGLEGGEEWDQREGTARISADLCPVVTVRRDRLCQLGWEVADILVTARNDFLEANPAARQLFEEVVLSILDVSLANVAQDNGADPTDLAVEWISLNRSTVDRWLAAARAAA